MVEEQVSSRSKGAIALPVLVVALAFAQVGPHPALGLAAAGAAALAGVLGGLRWTASRWGEGIVSAVVAALAFGLIGLWPETSGALQPPWTTAATVALFVSCARLFMARPYGGAMGTVAVAMVALAACGGSHASPIFYPVAVVGFAVAVIVARHVTDGVARPLEGLERRHLLGGAAGFAVAAAVAVAIALALPGARQKMLDEIAFDDSPQSGFSTRFSVGAMGEILLSDAVVMRVYGAPDAELMRGLVYTRYVGGEWLPRAGRRQHPHRAPEEAAGPSGAVEVEYVTSDVRFYFLPLNVTSVSAPSGLVMLDEMGAMAPPEGEVEGRLRYTEGPRGLPAPLAPEPFDLVMPTPVREALEARARAWTVGAETPRAKLEALERHLRADYTYTLDFKPAPGVDPIVDFVLRGEGAHCEYFASAMALLARTLGIHARVVGGYRLAERNSLGGYYLVRERNAHAWVEAHVPGDGWQTFDPTPIGDISNSVQETPLLAALFDLGLVYAERAWGWFQRRSLLEVVAGVLLLAVAFVLVRWLRLRRRRDDDAPPAPTYSDPLPCLEPLLNALAEAGATRGSAEPLETFARRLEEGAHLEAERADAASALILRYAALRYGGVGDREGLEADIRRFLGSAQ